jgi:hypothetical protein
MLTRYAALVFTILAFAASARAENAANTDIDLDFSIVAASVRLLSEVVPTGKTPALHCSAELQRSRTLAFSKPKYSSPFKNPALPLMQGDAIGTRL